MNRELITSRMQGYALTTFGMNFEDLDNKEKYTVFSKAIMEDILPQWQASLKKFDRKKKAYYLSAEFLMGRALSNNLINLRKLEEMKEMLEGLGIDYNALEEAESDAGLGALSALFPRQRYHRQHPGHARGAGYRGEGDQA